MNCSLILDTLDKATEADLAAIDSRVESIQKEIANLRRQIVSLSTFRKVMAERLGVSPEQPKAAISKPVKPRHNKSHNSAEDSRLAEQMYDLLSTNGPLTLGLVAIKLKRQMRVIARIAAGCDWFEIDDDDNVRIATK